MDGVNPDYIAAMSVAPGNEKFCLDFTNSLLPDSW